jgi:hypothetical protein
VSYTLPMLKAASLLLAGWSALCAGEIVLPATALERNAVVPAVYRTNSEATGKGELKIEWKDVYGRVVEDRKIPVELTDEAEIGFALDVRRAVAMKNELHVHFTFDGVNRKGEPDHRDEQSSITFIAKPEDRRWWDYTIMMWQNYPADQFGTLRQLGINGGVYGGKSKTPPDFLLRNDIRWYAENIATDFYSEYHRWHPDRPVNWKYTEAKALFKKDPSSIEAFKRHPSLSDPIWLRKIHDRLVDAARFWSPYRPIYYSLGDESGIADLAAFWDFDFSDESLVPMRQWLRERYGSLAALNRQWGTSFTTWDVVMPLTTSQAMKRSDDNFSAWADFKEWMDICYANALKMGTDAVHSVDPDAYVGIGGGQMPGWGGYDYARLTQALTAIEPYDIGANIEIIRSLNPRMAVVTTSFRAGPWEKHRVWYELLHGNRGLVIWDDKNEFIAKDGQVNGRGREAEPYYNELRKGVGSLLINGERLADPIAIHYSQASMRTEWMLQHRGEGNAWANRMSSTERKDSNFVRARESWCRLIEDEGLQYNFVSYLQVEAGELLRRGYKVLVMPHSNSLSAAEAAAIRQFVAQGGTVIADSEPGLFDEHSRRLPVGQLHDLPWGERGRTTLLKADVLNYVGDRLTGKEAPVHQLMGDWLRESGVRPEFAVTDDAGRAVVGVETHLFRNGAVYLIGLAGNPQLRIDDLGPAEFKSNERFEKPRTVKLRLPAEMYVYDVRRAKALGKHSELSVALDPYEPTIYAASPVAIPELHVAASTRVGRGETGEIALSFVSRSPANSHLLHIDVADPSGKIVAYYSGNLLAAGGRSVKLLPMAANDPAGKWEVRVKDLLSGQSQTVMVEVF